MAAYRDMTNPRWANTEHTIIRCEVFIEALGARVPFSAARDDVEPMGREIYRRAAAGDFGPVAPFMPVLGPPPNVISDRQFFQALALRGMITQAEAIDAVTVGTLPAILSDMISSMSGDEAFNAEMLLRGATTFERNHPLTAAIGAAQGMSPEQIDDFFRFAGSL